MRISTREFADGYLERSELKLILGEDSKCMSSVRTPVPQPTLAYIQTNHTRGGGGRITGPDRYLIRPMRSTLGKDLLRYTGPGRVKDVVYMDSERKPIVSP
jgi:hypothetical protein